MSLPKKISSDSKSSINSSLDLFDVDPTQTQVTHGFWEYVESTDFNQNSSQLKFHLVEDDRHFIDISECIVELEIKVVKNDGSVLSGTEANIAVWTGDNFGHTIFSKASVLVNGATEEYQDNYAEKAYIENLVNTSQTVKETHLVIEGWNSDTASLNGDEVVDENLAAKRAIVSGSRTFGVSISPKLALFQQDKMIPPGTAITLVLEKSDSKFALLAAAGNPADGGKVVITSAKMKVRKCVVTPRAHEVILAAWTGIALDGDSVHPRKPVKYTHKRAHVQRHTLSANSRNHAVTINGQRRPSRIFCALTSDAAASGDYQLNPFKFQHFGTQRIALTINGRPLDEDCKPNFETGSAMKEYQRFVAACGRQHYGSSNGVTYDSFTDGTTLFGWDISRTLSNQLEYVEDVQIRLEFTFAAALADTASLVTYLECDEQVQLSRGQPAIVI